ncbi:PAS domain S-box-containing protein [Algoriphagus boseongensis]|uniref:histidine kinase n=1 Tax=Algoriphagus boseongensis TaxID=1442587 RepID=A0A4R6T734_9BACT|nr:PAS domain-containing protein [Algoriphagus boseongensis]TDQ16470.1 PAS domain S-box-containing protein [Algoriphagus boseongensis]
MQSWESINVLSQMAITSEYFLQVTLDKSGKVISSDSGIGPVPTLFDHQHKPINFTDCFLSSDWAKYENQRIKAWKSRHQSFLVELQKINHPEDSTTLTKWEFFFISEDYGTCLGIGHPVDPTMPYSLGLGEFIEGNSGKNEILDSLLENKLLGFWEFDQEKQEDQISTGLAQMLGYQPEDLNSSVPISWQKHIHQEDYRPLVRELKQHLKTSGNIPFKKEFRLISKKNQVTWVVGFGKTSKWSKEGLPLKVQGLLIDITEKKKQELWLKEHHYFLQELAFQQSHSLRARVANISGILEIMETESLGSEAQKLLGIIKREVKMLDQSLKKSIKESVQQNEILERGISSSGSNIS